MSDLHECFKDGFPQLVSILTVRMFVFNIVWMIFFFYFAAPHSNSFPGHQPECDSASAKAIYNSWETTSRSAYVDPRVRLRPTQNPPTESPEKSS